MIRKTHVEPTTIPHSTPIGSYSEERKEELARKYSDPHEFDVEIEGDGDPDYSDGQAAEDAELDYLSGRFEE